MALESIRVFGNKSQDAPGVQIREQVGLPPSSPAVYGTAAMIGILKRGPMDVFIPYRTRSAYDDVCGKPKDVTWHLYNDSLKYGCPDAIDGFFNGSRDGSLLWVCRNGLDGTGKVAEQTFYARSDQNKPVLLLKAANPGRWAGYRQEPLSVKVISFEKDQFVINAPDVGANEFADATVYFTNSDGTTSKEYVIKSHTKAEADGTVEVQLYSDIDVEAAMSTEGFIPSVQATGTINYQQYINLTGTVAYDTSEDLVGTVKVERYSTTVYGDGTTFRTDLKKGDYVWVGGVQRKVTQVLSDTKLVTAAPFNIPDGDYAIAVTNYTLIGTGTAFTTELIVGDDIRWFSSADNTYLERKVRTIVSDTEIELYDSLPEAFTTDTIQLVNKWAEGTGTDFANELSVGDYINGYEGTSTVQVVAIESDGVNPDRILLASALGGDLVNSSLAIYPVSAMINLNPPVNNGVSIKIGNGQLYPETHFSIEVFFEGTSVKIFPDASLDPLDNFFVERVVNDGNVAYEDDGVRFYTWIEAQSLLTGEYITKEGEDLRPSNAFGTVLKVDAVAKKVYYFSNNDDKYISGLTDLYFEPYENPRSYTKSNGNLTKVKQLSGTYSSVGTAVTGVGTTFLADFAFGDFLYDPATKEVREIISVTDDLNLVIAEGFSTNAAAETLVYKLGEVKTSYYDVSTLKEGDNFLMSYFTDLEGGYDGDTENVPASSYARYFDDNANLLEKAALGRNNGLIRIAVPGIVDPVVQGAGVEYASSRAYEYRIEVPPTVTTAVGAERFIQSEIGRSDFASVSFPSYGYISDPRNGQSRLISLSGDIMGLESFKAAASAGYHNIAAGINARLRRVNSLPFFLDPFSDEELLNQVGIQPVVRKSGLIVLFGGRSPAETAIYRYTHIRRNQSQYIRTFAESPQLQALLFRANTPGLEQELMLYVRTFFETEQKKGAISSRLTFGQAVIMESNAGDSFNTAGNIYLSRVNNELFLNISYVPEDILERVILSVSPERVLSRTVSS